MDSKTPLITITEIKPIRLTVDGKEITVPEGSPVFDAVKKVGIELPAMCYHYAFSPFGSCGICLVEVEGKSNNVRSCTAKATEGMVVRTNTEKMIDARKKAVEKWLIIHPLDCPVCDADGKCELQDLTYKLGVYDIKPGKKKEVPEDTRSPILDFNMERCILCGQCINVCKEVQEIDALAFYKKDGKTLVGAHEGVPLDCEFCGDCLAVCPVGAITSRVSKYAYKPWQLKKTETTCTYCADGCTVTLETEGSKVMRVTSQLSYLSKFGHDVEPGDEHGGLCARGRFGFQFIQSEKRLSRPLAKINGVQTEIPWFRAIPQVARKLMEIKKTYGGEAIAGLISGRCTNEEVYLFQKMMRTVLGSNHIDTAARYGHMNSILAMHRTLGIGQSTTSYKKITLSDVILIIGSNITETNPVASLRIKEAKSKFGAKVIVADPMKTNMMKLCTNPLQIKMGGEAALLCGLVKAIVQNEWADPSFTNHTGAYQAIRKILAIPEETIVAQSGIAWDKIQEAANLLAQSKRGTIIWGEGITAQPGGYENILRLLDLAFLCGLFYKPGAGVHPVCEENNEQGAVDMGGAPEFLPGRIPYLAGRERFEHLWNTPLPSSVGLTLPGIIEKARQGAIKALYIVGENPLETLPSSMKVREAFQKIELIICQDPFLTPTGEMADYVLPATTFAEKTGTFTNMEGRIRPVNASLDPRGEARTDFKIFGDLLAQMMAGETLGRDQTVNGRGLSAGAMSTQIRSEINQVVPDYLYDARPAMDPEHLRHYLENDFTANVAQRYSGPWGGDLDSQDALTLRLGQIIYHSGKLSRQDAGLMKMYGAPKFKIGEADAKRLDLQNGDQVRVIRPPQGGVGGAGGTGGAATPIPPATLWPVTSQASPLPPRSTSAVSSECSSAPVSVEISPSLPEGMVWFPEHFTTLTNLMEVCADPVTHVPYFKSARVIVKKVPSLDLAVIPERSMSCRAEGNPDTTAVPTEGLRFWS